MKALRFAALLLPVALAGCILSTGQFNIDVDLDDPISIDSDQSYYAEVVDMNTNEDYVSHKDDLVGIADIALLGTAVNTGPADIDVEVWISPDASKYSDADDVRENAYKLWGPFAVGADSERRATWDESAALFNSTGKYVLLTELKGDGVFTMYALRTTEYLDAKTVPVAKTDGFAELSLNEGKLVITIEGKD